MDLDKIIRDNEHKAFSSKNPYEFEKAIMKEAIRQALELACERARIRKEGTVFQYKDEEPRLCLIDQVIPESIMSIMDEL